MNNSNESNSILNNNKNWKINIVDITNIPKEYFDKENFDKWTEEDFKKYILALYNIFELNKIYKKKIIGIEIEEFEKANEFEHWNGFKRVTEKSSENNGQVWIMQLALWGPNYGECAKEFGRILCAAKAFFDAKNDKELNYKSYWKIGIILNLIAAFLLIKSISIPWIFLKELIFLFLLYPSYRLIVKKNQFNTNVRHFLLENISQVGFDSEVSKKDIRSYLLMGVGVFSLFSLIIEVYIYIAIVICAVVIAQI